MNLAYTITNFNINKNEWDMTWILSNEPITTGLSLSGVI